MPDVRKPFGIDLNREQAAMLLKGLSLLSVEEKKNVIYTSLARDLETIVVVWDRRIKIEKMVADQRRKIKAAENLARADKSAQMLSKPAPTPPQPTK